MEEILVSMYIILRTTTAHFKTHVHCSCFQDFTYGDDYYEKWVLGDAGGPGLECHDFDHIDMPLQQVGRYL